MDSVQYTGFDVFYTSTEILLAIIGAIGNGFIIYIFFKDENLRKKSKNIYLISLSFADFMVTITGIPCCIMIYYGFPKNYTGCMLVLSTIIGFRVVSIYAVIVISVDRFMAVYNAIEYSKSNASKRNICEIN
jgi:hypothetical protein